MATLDFLGQRITVGDQVIRLASVRGVNPGPFHVINLDAVSGVDLFDGERVIKQLVPNRLLVVTDNLRRLSGNTVEIDAEHYNDLLVASIGF